MHIIIPLSGKGQRFINAGYKNPKPLITIDNIPIIECVINMFSKSDKYTFICSTEHVRDTNIEEVLTNIIPDCTIYNIPTHKLGPVYSVQQVFNSIENIENEGVIVSYCDYSCLWNYEAFKTYVKDYKLDGAIPYYTGFHPHMLGTDHYAYMLEKDNILIEINEKKPYKTNKFDEKASSGCYYFRNTMIMKKYFTELIDRKITCKNEYFVSLVYNLMVEDDCKIGLFEIEKMLQFGTPSDLEEFVKWYDYFKKYKSSDEFLDTSYKFFDKYDTTLILPFAGEGSRFNGFDKPKPLLDINNKPMFIEAVAQLPHTFKKIFICRQKHLQKYSIPKLITKYFGNYQLIPIDYLTEGQSCTVAVAFDRANPKTLDELLHKPILISACDCGLVYNKKLYQNLLDDNNIDIIVFSSHKDKGTTLNKEAYAWLDIDENNFITQVYCKKFPFDDSPENHYAITGTMLFKKGKYFLDNHNICVKNNIRVNGEFYIDSILNICIQNGLKVKMFCIDNYLNWGTPNDYNTYKYWADYFKLSNI